MHVKRFLFGTNHDEPDIRSLYFHKLITNLWYKFRVKINTHTKENLSTIY